MQGQERLRHRQQLEEGTGLANERWANRNRPTRNHEQDEKADQNDDIPTDHQNGQPMWNESQVGQNQERAHEEELVRKRIDILS